MRKKQGSQGDLNNVSLLHVIGKQHATKQTIEYIKSWSYIQVYSNIKKNI